MDDRLGRIWGITEISKRSAGGDGNLPPALPNRGHTIRIIGMRALGEYEGSMGPPQLKNNLSIHIAHPSQKNIHVWLTDNQDANSV
jgi:hypothetical protein